MTKTLARLLAHSPILARGRRLYAENAANWSIPLSKIGKLEAGLFLILDDYAKGVFPPTFSDQAAAYAAEAAYRSATGMPAEKATEIQMRKPFWDAKSTAGYLGDYVRLANHLQSLGLNPPARLLELGCGTGWTAEFLATTGFDVTGTSLVQEDIDDARKRIDSLRAKGLKCSLRFEAAPMESVSEAVGPRSYYDGVFVFEALHHAFDWRQSLRSAQECLKPGGWLLICGEPNLVHTFSSYRIARLSNTHEIGFSRGELMHQLRDSGFADVRYLSPFMHFWTKHHWICGRKK